MNDLIHNIVSWRQHIFDEVLCFPILDEFPLMVPETADMKFLRTTTFWQSLIQTLYLFLGSTWQQHFFQMNHLRRYTIINVKCGLFHVKPTQLTTLPTPIVNKFRSCTVYNQLEINMRKLFLTAFQVFLEIRSFKTFKYLSIYLMNNHKFGPNSLSTWLAELKWGLF
jgi:hypothetical protein